jgi:hypothetical protein
MLGANGYNSYWSPPRSSSGVQLPLLGRHLTQIMTREAHQKANLVPSNRFKETFVLLHPAHNTQHAYDAKVRRFTD